jgi:hypothetical protein
MESMGRGPGAAVPSRWSSRPSSLSRATAAIGRLAILALTGALALAACSHPQEPRLPSGPPISVRGRWLLRGGTTFVPRGVQIVGLVAPDRALTGPYLRAHQHFSLTELRAAITFHVDTIRFQVSQFGLDPGTALYSPAYVRDVLDAVHMARRLGLSVIVSVQAEPPAGQDHRCPLPDAGTLRVWDGMALALRNDRGVMFELYNEPDVPPTVLGWALWKNGGPVNSPAGSCVAVGMQQLIDAIRSRGAKNVLIVPGAGWQRTIAGMPALVDPSSPAAPQLAYGIHYPPLGGGRQTWQQNFGAASARVPVIVSEWNAGSTGHCDPAAPVAAPMLLAYLASRGIGVVGFAFDRPGSIIRNWAYVPTSYHGFQCGIPGSGPGQLLFSRFRAAAGA